VDVDAAPEFDAGALPETVAVDGAPAVVVGWTRLANMSQSAMS
jgi:hypothetical protein